jgi:uncharacterized protein (DUF58 family)
MSGAAAAPVSASASAPRDSRSPRRFDDHFLGRLETLAVTVRRISRARAGLLRGNRRSRRVGAGLEFADHRDYAPGDDPRHLDWNLYGRLGRLALRLYEEDEDLSIDVLVDASASMGVGRPPKLDLALQIGAALAYVGLANLDRVAVTAFAGADAPTLPFSRGKAAILPTLRRLEGVVPAGRTALAAAVRGFLARGRGRRRGLVILISDFYDPEGHRPALDLLRHHHLEVVAVQVSAPEEIAPALRGDLRVRDIETGELRDLVVSPAVLAAYTRRREALLRGLQSTCREREIPCFTVLSDRPFDAAVLDMFRSGGLLR